MKGDLLKLGVEGRFDVIVHGANCQSISSVQVQRELGSLWVVNAYTQLHYRGAGVRVDYDAVRSAMRLVKQQFTGKRIGYPRIGAGLARGDWTLLAPIIDEELEGEDHTLVEYEPS